MVTHAAAYAGALRPPTQLVIVAGCIALASTAALLMPPQGWLVTIPAPHCTLHRAPPHTAPCIVHLPTLHPASCTFRTLLIQVRIMRLQHNRWHGPLPPEIFQMSSLEYLFLSDNRLSGSIPPQLPSSSCLRTMDVASNRLTGSIPSALAGFVSLEFLSLHSNLLQGSIPPLLFVNWTKLVVLMLQNNSLTSQIPFFPAAPNLQWLLLNSNRFVGPVPWELLNTVQRLSLRVLSLANNQLSGGVPGPLPPMLEQLILDNNAFTGPLPSFGGLLQLQTLTIHQNRFKGRLELPAGLTTLFAHNNYGLSCPIKVLSHGSSSGQSTEPQLRARNLVLAGRHMHRAPALMPSHAQGTSTDANTCTRHHH